MSPWAAFWYMLNWSARFRASLGHRPAPWWWQVKHALVGAYLLRAWVNHPEGYEGVPSRWWWGLWPLA